MNELRLAGCSPEPLANYLKALGILRLVTEQKDNDAKGWWEGGAFVLGTVLDEEGLLRFFEDEVCPTPIIGPWSGGSGFFPKDGQAGIGPISTSTSPRFKAYRESVTAARRVLQRSGLVQKPETGQKPALLEALRAELPDSAIQWMDSALALTDDGPKFPPLLGSGGNDGRLDFTNNQMQRWVELLLTTPRPPTSWLRHALFADAAADLSRACAIGQFDPAAAGGSNMAAAFDRDSLVNPWSFVLMLEGALLFASSVTRRLEDTRKGALVYPFTVRASGVGYSSASLSDETTSRAEIWLPEWSRKASLAELKTLFAEGRARVRSAGSTRAADTGLDFARALQDLGVQRGLSAFTRYGFHKRNGLAYLAVPLARWEVRGEVAVDVLAPLDPWMQRFRRGAKDKTAPASVRAALSGLEAAALDLCAARTPSSAQAVLFALGSAERALAKSRKFTEKAFLRPVDGVSPEWLDHADDGSVEWRLAAALASSGLRDHLVPVRAGRWADHDDGRTVWGERALVPNLLAVLRRQAIDRERSTPTREPTVFAHLSDISAFIAGDVDDGRLDELLRGASLIDFRTGAPLTPRLDDATMPPYAFAVCALTWQRGVVLSPHRHDDVALPAAPTVLARLVAGDARAAVDAAHRRLHGSGLKLRVGYGTQVSVSTVTTRRLAAAQLFPMSHPTRRTLAAEVIINPKVESP